jgi:hypothetical protein
VIRVVALKSRVAKVSFLSNGGDRADEAAFDRKEPLPKSAEIGETGRGALPGTIPQR